MKHARARRSGSLLLAAAITVVVAACGGGGNDTATAMRSPTDPRRVPTATIPAERAAPLTALEVGAAGGGGRPVPETYTVRSGDTIGTIARDLGVAADELIRANGNLDPRALRVGQELRVPRPTPAPVTNQPPRGPATPLPAGRSPAPGVSPAPGSSPTPAASPGRAPSGSPAPSPSPGGAAGTYTVQSGDTGCEIARKLGVSLAALAQANSTTISGLADLRIGQVLQVPAARGESPGC
jgi:N-acetylmuramoyl-L-alanine amidase